MEVHLVNVLFRIFTALLRLISRHPGITDAIQARFSISQVGATPNVGFVRQIVRRLEQTLQVKKIIGGSPRIRFTFQSAVSLVDACGKTTLGIYFEMR